MTNNEAIKKMDEWMTYRGLATSTKKNYVMHVELLSRYFGKPLFELSKDEVKEYLYTEAKTKKLSASYSNLSYASIRLMYEQIFERDSFMKTIPRRKRKHKDLTVFTKDEVKKLIHAADNLRDKALLLTIYSAGLRLSEAAHLKISDIDSKKMRIFVEQGKGSKDRHTLLAQNTLQILREYYKKYRPKKWLFPGRSIGEPLSCKTIQHIFRKSKNRVKINHPKPSVHGLRHAFCTHLIESGVDILVLKELVGHSNIESTSKYVHLANKDKLKVVSPADVMGGIFND